MVSTCPSDTELVAETLLAPDALSLSGRPLSVVPPSLVNRPGRKVGNRAIALLARLVIDPDVPIWVLALAFVGLFVVLCAAMVYSDRLRARRRAAHP